MSVFLLPHSAISNPVLSSKFLERTNLLSVSPKIKSIAMHILETGLLNPIVVRCVRPSTHSKSETSKTNRSILETMSGSKFETKPIYEVVDGFKRLRAILHLKRTGRLPRTLKSIPCISVEALEETVQDKVKPMTLMGSTPIMLSEAELSHEIMSGLRSGASKEALMVQFECHADVFDKIVSLKFLHPKIKACFDDGHLSLEQAAAFAMFPNVEAQWRLMEQLGPSVNSKDILAQLTGPDNFVDLPDGDILILPTRRNLPVETPRSHRSPAAPRIAA